MANGIDIFNSVVQTIWIITIEVLASGTGRIYT